MAGQRIVELGHFNKIVCGRDAFYIANENDLYIGRSLLRYGEYCQEEFELLATAARPGAVIVEVGANVGAHTVRLARKVGPEGRVLAFEPQQPVFQSLCGAVALNGLTNVECYPYALGMDEGEVTVPPIIYDRPANFGDLSLSKPWDKGIPVPLMPLDAVFRKERLDLVKIDVEGMELEVLEGGRETIARFKPVLYVENDQREKSPTLLAWMLAAGYRLWWHAPPLFNPNNHFGESENIFGPVRSLNVLAVPKGLPTDIALPEITDPDDFPATTRDDAPAP